MDFNKTLAEMILRESDYFIKDALDKVITGETPSEKELAALLKKGLIDAKGTPTQKAKEEYSELFESLTEGNVTKMTKGDKQILWSYKTPVAVKIGDTVYVTKTKYSTTTLKHINSFVGDSERVEKPESYFKKFGMLD